ncbi:MAG: serine kinase [Litoreibacter sp.]|nr:serine kinase [Litoreibacter sp.]
MTGASETRHASAVSAGDAGVLILGASGSGKSALALQLLGLGAKLIADDQVALSRQADQVLLSKPETLPSKIEARGIGLLDAPMSHEARLALLVDLDQRQTMRSPEQRSHDVLGVPVTIWRYIDAPYFPAAVLLYLESVATDSGQGS